MFRFDLFSVIYDIIAYMIAAKSLVDELLYKVGLKRHLDVKNELPADLSNQIAIITGGTRGIGLTVVRTLLTKGCTVYVASSQTRDNFSSLTSKIYDGLAEKDEVTGVARGKLHLEYIDLSSMDSVSKFVKAFQDTKLDLNYLICNAGIMFAPRSLTVDNFESHLAVNYLGHCLLILELLPKLKETADKTKTNSRVVSVASSTHHITRFRFEDLLAESNYSSSQAYAQSKLAQIMFNAKLSRFLKDSIRWYNIQCFSLHPGVILSDLYEHVHLIKYLPFLVPLIKLVTRDMVQGAETTLYALLSDELKGLSGLYLENCAVKEPGRRALIQDDQEKLWEVTNKLLEPWLTQKYYKNKKTV